MKITHPTKRGGDDPTRHRQHVGVRPVDCGRSDRMTLADSSDETNELSAGTIHHLLPRHNVHR